MKQATIRLLAVLLALLMLCIGLASCAKESEVAGDVKYDNLEPSEKTPTVNGAMGNGFHSSSDQSSVSTPTLADRKLIKNFDISAETTEFEKAIEALNGLIAAHGAYVENSTQRDKSLYNQSRYARGATYTIRVPADQAEAFTNALGGHFNVTSQSATVKDISEAYYSIEASLAELIVERDSLLDILALPETEKDYDLWLTVHQRITEIKQQIAVYQGTLNRYDSQVAYSTVRLSVDEVITYTVMSEGNGFFARMGTAFRRGWTNFLDGLQDFAIWFAEALPSLILFTVIAIGLFFLIRTIIRRFNAKKISKKMMAEEEIAPTEEEKE
jgi:hypothetical protein